MISHKSFIANDSISNLNIERVTRVKGYHLTPSQIEKSQKNMISKKGEGYKHSKSIMMRGGEDKNRSK